MDFILTFLRHPRQSYLHEHELPSSLSHPESSSQTSCISDKSYPQSFLPHTYQLCTSCRWGEREEDLIKPGYFTYTDYHFVSSSTAPLALNGWHIVYQFILSDLLKIIFAWLTQSLWHLAHIIQFCQFSVAENIFCLSSMKYSPEVPC